MIREMTEEEIRIATAPKMSTFQELIEAHWPAVTVDRHILHEKSYVYENGIHAKWSYDTGLLINTERDIETAEVFESSMGKTLNITLKDCPKEG